MTRNTITQLLACLLTLSHFTQAEVIAYSGGQGTVASPYVLSCKEDIVELASRPADYDKSFLLTADIDLDGTVFAQSIISPNAVLLPAFGEYENLFTGCFNGSGHVIKNFSVTGEGTLGFIGAVGQAGRVMHLGLQDVRIDGPGASYVGILAGVNRGTIVGCYTQGCVSGHGSVGGLVGYQLKGRIVDCYSQGRVEGVAGGVGGLVGNHWEGEIRRCYAASTVSSGDLAGCGGLVGAPVSGGRGSPPRAVLDSFWDVDVSGLATSRGGLGLSTDAMYDVSNYIDAKWDFANEQSNGIIDIWAVSGEGGYPVLSAFSGIAPVWLPGEGNRDNAYVVSTARELAAMGYYGDSYYFDLDGDIDLSAIEWSVPIIGEFKGYLDGQGHSLRGFRQDGSCGLFGTIASDSTVTNLRLEECEVKAEGGIIGCIAGENDGRITECSVTGIVVGGDITGGLVGHNAGDVAGCFFSGPIIGVGKAGGLVGGNAGIMINSGSRGAVSGDCSIGGLAGDNRGSIRSCYSLASVVGYSDLGGLVGTNDGVVADCYARGSVAGAYCVGGLIGQNSRIVSRSYSTGSVTGLYDPGGLIACDDFTAGGALDSFWDIDASGIETSDGGTGATVFQMQDMNTFLEAGWDFVGESTNGTADLWVAGDDSYPDLSLSLEIAPGRR